MPKSHLAANAVTMPPQPLPAARDLIADLSVLPPRYAMPILGDCLEPKFRDGAILIFSKSEAFDVGDFVLLWRRPEATPAGQCQGLVKRLIMPPPPWVTFPYIEHPRSDVSPAVGFETLNPQAQFGVRCSTLLGIHKCIGAAPTGVVREAVQIPASRGARRRR